MRIKTLFFPILLGVSTVYADDIEDIISAFDSISDATDRLGKGFYTWSGKVKDIQWLYLIFSSRVVFQEIEIATITAEQSRKLNDTEYFEIKDPAERLIESINITMANAIQAKQKSKDNNLECDTPMLKVIQDAILQGLIQQRQIWAVFSDAIINVFLGDVGRGDAIAIGETIQGLFDTTIAVYEGGV